MKTKENLSTTSFCLAENTLDRVREAARKNGMSSSTFYRMAILAMLKRFEDFEWIKANEDTLPGGIHHPIDVVDGDVQYDPNLSHVKHHHKWDLETTC